MLPLLPGFAPRQDADIAVKRVEPPLFVRSPAAWDSLGRALAQTHVVSLTVSVRDTTRLNDGTLRALRKGLAAVAPYVARVGDIGQHVGFGYPVRFAVGVQADDPSEMIDRVRAAVQAFVDYPPLSLAGPDQRAVDQMLIDMVDVLFVFPGDVSARSRSGFGVRL